MRVELKAIHCARRHFERDGYTVTDVSRKRGHNGYDLLIEQDGQELKIEVKRATRRWGIPNPCHTEFDENRRLVADMLCIVYFIETELPKLCLIPRAAIDPAHVSIRTGCRISSKFKNEGSLERFIVSLANEDGQS